ncbi:hypothetical protein IWW54_003516, partial [Coemansia sp. RSA 2705]
YLASASIDKTCRIWSLEAQEPVFTFETPYFCWCVRFVYPFYFLPDRDASPFKHPGGELVDDIDTNSSSSGGALPFDGRALRSGDSESHSEQSESRRSVEPNLIDYVVGHAGDVQNGYTSAAVTPDAGDHEESMRAAGVCRPSRIPLEPEGLLPAVASPLLLCSTWRDVLLLDPTQPQSPVVDKIGRIAARTPLPTLSELITFDRVAFLEWYPEMGIAIAGSLSGTVAIIGLCTNLDDEHLRHSMRILGRVPEEVPTHPLYGVALYRHPDSATDARGATLYLLYLDGQLLAYELS